MKLVPRATLHVVVAAPVEDEDPVAVAVVAAEDVAIAASPENLAGNPRCGVP